MGSCSFVTRIEIQLYSSAYIASSTILCLASYNRRRCARCCGAWFLKIVLDSLGLSNATGVDWQANAYLQNYFPCYCCCSLRKNMVELNSQQPIWNLDETRTQRIVGGPVVNSALFAVVEILMRLHTSRQYAPRTTSSMRTTWLMRLFFSIYDLIFFSGPADGSEE